VKTNGRTSTFSRGANYGEQVNEAVRKALHAGRLMAGEETAPSTPRLSTYRPLCRNSDVVSRLRALPRTTITNMIGVALFDEQSRLVQLDDEIPKAAVTALLPFRGIW